MKKLLLLVLATISIGAFASCGDKISNGEDTGIDNIIVWEDVNNIELVTKQCNEFAAMYKKQYPKAPSLKFEFVPHSEQSAIEDLTLAGPAGNGPDIVAFVHDTLGKAVDADLLAVNSFADKLANEQISTAVNAATYKDNVYGFPITSESQILVYKKNKISVEQAKNIETIIGATDANAKLIWDVLEGYYSFGIMTDALLYGPNQMTTEGSRESYINFNKPQTLSNVKHLKTLKANSNLIVPGVTNGKTDIEGLAKFLDSSSNGADAIIVAPYFYSEAVAQLGAANVGMAPLPKLNGVDMRPLSGYKLYGVSKYSTKPAISQMLADFLVNEESQAVRLRDKSLLPTNKQLLDKIANAGSGSIVLSNWRKLDTTKITITNEQVKQALIFKASLDNSITMPSLPRFSAFWVAYTNNMKQIWDNSYSDDQIKGKLEDMTAGM